MGAGLRTGQIDRTGGLLAFLPARWQESLAESNPEINSGVGPVAAVDLPHAHGQASVQQHESAAGIVARHPARGSQRAVLRRSRLSVLMAGVADQRALLRREAGPALHATAHPRGIGCQCAVADRPRRRPGGSGCLREAGYPDGFEFELLSPPSGRSSPSCIPRTGRRSASPPTSTCRSPRSCRR